MPLVTTEILHFCGYVVEKIYDTDNPGSEERRLLRPDGSPFVHEIFQNGELEGERRVWQDNGKLKKREFYRNGKKEGKCEGFGNNGNISILETYHENKLNGECKLWYADGKLAVHQFYKDGKRDGERKHWDANGDMISHTYHIDGNLEYNFTWEIRHAFIHLKRRACARRSSPAIDPHMIPDLSKMICEYVSG